MQLAVSASSIVGGMVLPGLLGGYLDSRLGTNFCVLIGIGLGVVAGTVQLLALARRGAKADKKPGPNDDNEDSGRDPGS